jgi:ethanolamine utilization protein EutN
MQRCQVTGSTVATQKAAGLGGFSLLNVTPVGGGTEIVAVDLVGAGEGDMVLVALGTAARETEQTRGVPTDAAVVAIVDPSR